MRKVASPHRAVVVAVLLAVAAVLAAGMLPVPLSGPGAGSPRGTRTPGSAPGPRETPSRASRDTAALLHAYYRAFADGNISAARRLVGDDFVMHVPGKGLNAGE